MFHERDLILYHNIDLDPNKVERTYQLIETYIQSHGLEETLRLSVIPSSRIERERLMLVIFPDAALYELIEDEDIEHIFAAHILRNESYDKRLVEDHERYFNDTLLKPYARFLKQKRIALRNCGNIDFNDIEDYIAHDGYFGLAKAIFEMTPIEAIDLVRQSGLRGRGGGGFSTGQKWAFAYENDASEKFVVCNADEGDPGAFMDRAILEGDPHSVLEAMAICGYAIGSSQGYIYIRAEYPTAVKRLNHAIQEAREKNLLGQNILGTDFDFDIELRLGSGAFVCGEETALIQSIEGYRGMPKLKPPYPAASGLWGKPTNVNNVETFANIPVIFTKGAAWFKSIGTEASSGTKVFALGGKIKNTGLIEVPMGTTLREVIEDIGGGIPNRKKFKAVQTGGPSGGCITIKDIDTGIDFDRLTALGSMMGSGGMIIMDEDNCMVDVARFYLEFTVEESCGKCTPCREGTKRMLDIMDRICQGQGKLEDLDTLEELGNMIKETSLCGLGQTAPNPVLSTLKHFRNEYVAHVIDKECPAGVCRELTNFYIHDNCIGCTKCATNCPVGAIKGWPRNVHELDLELCIRCGACKQMCPVGAITTSKINRTEAN
jgi:NADH:ubiquinone oxidoreductase subunit F (NADH-binding)/(2Fe-2S) ferredoxin